MGSMNNDAPPALVVGTGFGCRIHIPALRAAGFEVVGLVGTNAERTLRRAQASGVPNVFTDLDEAIRQTGAVAVTIASPPHTHAALTLTALSHGCHVICEKPMASNVAEASAMVAAAEQAGVTALLGNEFRWQPDRAIIARALADALAAVAHVGQPGFKILLGTMHFFRLGGTVADVAAIDPAAIGYVQLCDAPLQSAFPTYMEEALHERLIPGTGDLPLAALLALVPNDVVVSVEVPQRSLAEAGVQPRERVAACVSAARRLLGTPTSLLEN